MTGSRDADRAPTSAVDEPIDPADEGADDGEWGSANGETREEYLTALQDAHDDGNIRIDDDTWFDREDAVAEVGAKEAARLRKEMGTFLRDAWAELERKQQ